LYRLAELTGEDKGDGSGFWTIDALALNWNKIWVSSFNDNAGSIYESLPTPFTVSPFTRPVATQHLYRCSLKFSPLVAPAIISTDENGDTVVEKQTTETAPAEINIYKSIIYPAYPLLFASSVSTHTHFGPVFLSNAKISTSGQNKLGQVEISIDFEGGKSLSSPEINSESPELVVIDPQKLTDSNGNTTDSSEAEESNFDYKFYRSASLMDCLAAYKLYSTISEMELEMNELNPQEAFSPEDRLVSMSIDVKQEIHYEFPVPSKGRTDSNGPRFASFPNRAVTGSLIYWSRSKNFELPNTQSLTLFFGGKWFFPMPNIEWQKPSMESVPNQGYLHTFSFIARAADYAIQKGFVTDAANYPVSEFWISSNDIDAPAGFTQDSEEEN
jgi:hypothetical protein